MKSILVALFALFCCLPLTGQDSTSAPDRGQRKDYVSDASYVVGTYSPSGRDHSPAGMAAAANRFLQSLDQQQRGKVVFDLKSRERREWTNLPARPGAGGLRMGELREEQVKAACDLMAALFSERGYSKMIDIMLADDQLLRGGRPRQGFGTEDFSIVIFGNPSASEPWAFQLDGHHIGVNVSVSGQRYSMSPSFIGTQPESFKIADRQFQPLAGESGLAYQLVASLSDQQKKQAIIRPKRATLLTGPGTDGNVPSAKGVSCATFDERQQKLLVSLISEWVMLQPERHAEPRMKQLRSEIDQMKFAWNGPTADRSDVSYTIQGPSLIIEFACQSLGGNPLDHLHTMYRDLNNEYAGQLD